MCSVLGQTLAVNGEEERVVAVFANQEMAAHLLHTGSSAEIKITDVSVLKLPTSFPKNCCNNKPSRLALTFAPCVEIEFSPRIPCGRLAWT